MGKIGPGAKMTKRGNVVVPTTVKPKENPTIVIVGLTKKANPVIVMAGKE